MDVYTTEEQQVEAIKKWWRENRWSLIGGVAIGAMVLIGGRGWLDNKHAHTEAASTVYEIMLQELSQDRFGEAEEHGKQLLGEFSNTPYAALAAFGMARIKTEAGELSAATPHLRWVLSNAEEEEIKHEAKLRLARLLLAQNKLQEAQALLEDVELGAYSSPSEILLGDIHLAAGRTDQARQTYMNALAGIVPGTPGRELLQMKLDNLGSGNSN